MAEESPVSNAMSRYYCHACDEEVNDVMPEIKCPRCEMGFVEILEDAHGHAEDEGDEEEEDLLNSVQPLEMLNYVLMGINGGGLEERFTSRREQRRSGRSGRNRQMVPVENLLHEFILNLTNGGLGGQLRNSGSGNVTNGPVLFLGNPGDYAWGQNGLDAIVTHLLNQMDGTGPPPLAKDKIQEIPNVIITQDQVDSSLQCSVCWEDFKVDESVKKLSCEHVYHSPCIIPWLELHGTCPICRKTLNEGGSDSNEESNNASGSVVNSVYSLFRNPESSRLYSTAVSQPSPNTSASNNSSSSSSSSSSRGSEYMDLDYND